MEDSHHSPSWTRGYWTGVAVALAGFAGLALIMVQDVTGCFGPTGRVCIVVFRFGIPGINY